MGRSTEESELSFQRVLRRSVSPCSSVGDVGVLRLDNQASSPER
jgi:hypothetical protein